jgi:hypothetical protein
MTPKDSDSFSEGDWDDSEELRWNEFDWEKFLRKQDDALHRYLGFYEAFIHCEDRLDKVAHLMGWDEEDDEEDLEDEEEALDSAEPTDELDPYTLQRNPVYVAASALYLSLSREWESLVLDGTKAPPSLSLPFQASLFVGERHMLQGIQALDMGDYTMSISLFKRAMRELNLTLSFLNGPAFEEGTALAAFHDSAMVRLFDLREVLLRVIAEARDEVSRHSGTGDDDGDGDKRGQA